MARMNDWQRETHEAVRREMWSIRGPNQIRKGLTSRRGLRLRHSEDTLRWASIYSIRRPCKSKLLLAYLRLSSRGSENLSLYGACPKRRNMSMNSPQSFLAVWHTTRPTAIPPILREIGRSINGESSQEFRSQLIREVFLI